MAVPRRTSPYRNPFFVVLLAASLAFLVTALGYLISPTVLKQAKLAGAEGRPGSPALAAWLDRRGPTALGAEFAVMLGAAVLAMSTDGWFARGAAGRDA